MKSETKLKAVFLDRDGTVIRDIPYLNDPAKIQIFEEGFEAVRLLNENGFKVYLATNQSGVARGLIQEPIVNEINSIIIAEFEKRGAKIEGAYYCPHSVDAGCLCRKPSPGMLIRASENHNIDLSQSWMVGDRMIDVLCGKNAGSRSIMLKNSHTPVEEPLKGTPEVIKENLLLAANFIISAKLQ